MLNPIRAPRVITAICLGAWLVAGVAQTATTAPTATATTASPPASNKLVGEYTVWAGSRQNAEALVLGMRNGTLVNLGTPAAGTTFTPTTTKLGNGEVNTALSLAKAALAQQGITQPTPAQIEAALNGGTITTAKGTLTMPGVLAQRQSGMGWGQIAHAMGVKLGAVVSASKSGKEANNTLHAKETTKSHTKVDPTANHGKSENGGNGNSSHGGGGGGGKK